MHYLLKLRMCYLLLFAVLACNDAGVTTTTDTNANTMQPVETGTTVSGCAAHIPSSLVNELAGKTIPVTYLSNTDSTCMAQFEEENKPNKSLTLIWERFTDTAQLKRKIKTFTYLPGFIEEFNAGDQAVVTRMTEKNTDVFILVFRLGNTGCSITSKMPAGEEASTGILFSAEKLKELALRWVQHLNTTQP